MRSAVPKVLHPLGGRPLILHVVDSVSTVADGRPIAVISPGQPEVRALLDGAADCVEQRQPLGTGDALRSVPEALRTKGPTLVVSADVPLLRTETLQRLTSTHAASEVACTLLSVVPDDPTGLGRIVRDDRGQVERIVEEGDLPPEMVAPVECNVGVYVFDGDALWPALDRITPDNAQREYYLTEIIELLGGPVQALVVTDPTEALGINDRRQLATAEAALRQRVLDVLMLSGVTLEDPATTFVDSTVQVGQDSVLRPMTTLRGSTTVGSASVVGPGAELENVRAGDHVTIGASHLEDCVLGDDVRIGSFNRVRPNTVLGSGVQLGTHAEVKNSTVGAGTRIGHFSCVLDSDVGKDVNVGAGTVTCNFDGEAKHRTTIGDGVFIGSNSTLVAPVRIGERAYIGAGSVIDMDVPPGALAVGRAKQRNIEGWVARRRSVRT